MNFINFKNRTLDKDSYQSKEKCRKGKKKKVFGNVLKDIKTPV